MGDDQEKKIVIEQRPTITVNEFEDLCGEVLRVAKAIEESGNVTAKQKKVCRAGAFDICKMLGISVSVSAEDPFKIISPGNPG